MASGGAIHVSAGDGRIGIRHDKLHLTRRFRARLSEIGDVRSSLTAHAAIGSQQEPGCSKGHAL
jgi:hypothetical protein